MSGRSTAASKRAWEQRFRRSGARMVGVRLSAVAADTLATLRTQHDCSDRDVIEGLLLGTIVVTTFASEVQRVMKEHGFNREEANLIVANGWNT